MPKFEAEQVYTSREVATLLGLGGAMLRRYAIAYEQAIGAQLPLDRRDGRTFAEKDVTVLSQARNLVATQGLPVNKALEMVLIQSENAPKPLVSVPTVNGEALAAVLTQAITEAQRPLLGELQAMRVELEALRLEVAVSRALPDAERAAAVEGDGGGADERPGGHTGAVEGQPDGAVVRLARWLEQFLQRFR